MGPLPPQSDRTARRHGPRLPLQAYLAVLVAVFVVIGGAAFAYQRSNSRAEARRAAAERVEFLAGLAADDLTEAVELVQQTVAELAASPALAAIVGQPTPGECTLSFSGSGPFGSGHLDIVDAEGTVLCSSMPLPDAAVYADAEWLDPGAAGPIVVGPVDDGATGRRALVLATPVAASGMVAAFLELDPVPAALDVAFGGSLDAAFVLIDDPPASAAELGSGTGRITRTATVPLLGWEVASSIDRGTATAAVDDLHRRELVVLLLALVALLVATQLVYRRLARPIERLSAAVRGATTGDATSPVAMTGPAEVVSLAADFANLRRDISTELARRRQAEDEAQTSAARYRLLFDRNPHPMWVQDRGTGELLEVNDAMVERFGRPRAELLSMRVGELAASEQAAAFAEAMGGDERVVRSGPWPLLGRDGDVVECELTSDALDLDGRRGRLVIAEDVTARLRSQRLLQQAERMDSLGQLAGGIAHDFNNLLAVMLNYADFAAEELAPAATADPDRWQPVLHDIEQVGAAGRRAVGLTQQLLAFARGDSAEAGPVDLNEVAGGLEDLLRRTLGEHIALGLSLGDGLWPVLADRGQLEQVIVNLAVNARDAMPGGGSLAIETATVDVDEHHAEGRPELRVGRYVRLRVSDTGEGMVAAVRDRVFEPFFTTKDRGSGTGLGLATVYGIVSRAGGGIYVYSEPGLGTSFSALFPAAEQPVGPVPAPERRRPSKGNETVLVVEDDDDLRALAERILVGDGYRVLAAADGQAALDLAAERAGEIDLVLTDVVMPGMLGSELATRLRAAQPRMRVLLMSGYASPVLVSGGRLTAGGPLLDKPFSAALLAEKVREALDAPPPA